MAETTMEAVPIPTEEPKREKKKRKFSFPSAFTILFIVTIIAVICTWFVPAGQYSKLLYDSESGKLEMTTPTGEAAPSPRRCLFPAPMKGSIRIRCRLPTFPTPWSGA